MSEIFAAEWDGEHMVPLQRFRKECDKYFVIGERYILETMEQRSSASHRNFFAALKSAWENLPGDVGRDYQTPEHFRKRLLIEAGFCDIQKTVFSYSNDAIMAASLVVARDDYCVAKVDGRALTIWTAKSQSMKAMGKDDFQRSKEAVLELAAAKIGTTTDELAKASTHSLPKEPTP